MDCEPYDSGDLDAILELERSPGYALVAKRIGEELQRRRDELEHSEFDWQAMIAARGQIKALKIALAIPDILKVEIKAGLDRE
jgi:hypothetical protein